MIFAYVPRLLLALIFLSGVSLQALAGEALDNWRVEMVQVRGLAENNIPQAYTRAQHLQSSLPGDATAADRVRLLNLLARIELYRGESAAVDRYAKQALELAANNGDRTGQAETDLLVSLNAVNQSQFERMKAAIHHSMEMLEGSDRKELLVEAMLRTSMMYLRFGLQDEATTMAMQTLEIARHGSNPLALTYAHQGMAIIYDQSGNHSEARDHYKKMLGYAQDAHSRLLEADALLGLGTTLLDLGDAASGERLVLDAVNIYRRAGGPFYTAHALNMLANFQHKRKHLAAALASLDEAAQIYEQRQNKVGLWWTLRNRSEVSESANKIDLSQADAERGYKLAREMGVALYLGGSAHRLAALAAKRGNFKKAYELFAEAEEMAKKDEFEKSRKRIFDLAQQFEEESKQRKIIELLQKNEVQVAQQRWLWTVAVGSIALLGLTFFFLLRMRRAKHHLQSAYTQLDQTRSKLAATLDAVPDLLFELGLDGTYFDFHSPQSDLLVQPAGQLIGRKIGDVLPAAAADTCLAALREAHERGISLGKQYALDLPLGHCWFEISVARKPVAAGETARFIMLVRDITERKQAERLLHEQEQAMVAVVEHSPDAIARYDKKLRRIYVNPATEKLYGMSYDNIVGHSVDELPPLPDDFTQILQTVFESRHELSIELPFRTKEATPGWADIRLVPEFGRDGDILSVLSIGRDITERKRAEDQLREERGIFAGGPTVVFKWRAEAGWPVEYVSPNVVDQFGYAPYQLTEGEIAFGTLIHPEDAERISAEVAEYMAQGRTAYEQEYRIAHADGSYRWIYDFTVVTYQENGSVLHFLGYVLDITERKQAEQELRKHREHLEELVEARTQDLRASELQLRENRQMLNEAQRIAGVGSWEMNLLDNILTWSDEVYRIFEMDPQQFGASYEAFMDTVHPDDRQALDRAFKTSLANRERFEIEHRLLLPDGRIKFVFECCENYFDENGRAVRSLGTVQDITERKQAEESRNALQRQLQIIADNLPGAMCYYRMFPDGSGKMLYANDGLRDIFGFSLADLADDITPMAHRIHSGDLPHMIEQMRQAAVEQRTYTTEFRVNHPDKGEIWVLQTSTPVYESAGSMLWYGLMFDITARKTAETKLKEALEFSEGIINAIPDILFELDREGHYLNVWTQNPELLAAQREVLLGRTFSEVLSPEAAAASMDAMREADEKGYVQGKDICIDLPQGKRWFSHTISKKIGGVSGKVTFLALSRDITERKQLEEALAESEARYRYHFNQLQSMLESASSVSVFALDREYRYLFFNKRHRDGAKRIRGTDIEIGMNMIDSIPDEAFRDFCRQGFDHVLAGNSVSVESKERVVRDGIPAYEYSDNFGSPIYNDAGEVIGLTVFAINTTERKRLEAELRDSRNFLDSVIDAVPDPIFVKDRQHNWILLNEAFCRFTSLPHEALIGKSDYDVFPKAEADLYWEKDELVFASGEVNLNEEPFTSADGVTHHIQTKKTPFVSADGRQMLVGVIRDISERIQYETAREAALLEAQRLADLRSEFIAHMSHELRTPLNGILGYAQMLARDDALDDKQQASVEVIRHSGEHLLALIEDILDLARIESGRLEFDFSDIPLCAFLNGVAGMIRVRAKEKKIVLVTDFAADLPQGVRGDEKRLRQVLLNLLSNAVKFTDRGEVTLTVSRASSSRLKFEVSDTGIGISAADREKIFKSFEQVGDRRYRIGGTGLGLSISRQLVCLMGSDIAFESTPGKGSTFHFELALPEVNIAPETLPTPISDTQSDEIAPEEGVLETMIAPPPAEMHDLHRLALLGNMRDIKKYADHVAGLDARYIPFADHLKRLADSYRSKAILEFVKENLS